MASLLALIDGHILNIRILVRMVIHVCFLFVFASVCYAGCDSNGSGNWNSSSTWSCGHVPTTADDTRIVSGHNVVLNVTTAAVKSLRVDGTLSESGAFTLNIGGDVRMDGTINIPTSTIKLGANSQWQGAGTTINASALDLGFNALTFKDNTVAFTISLSGATPLLNSGSLNNNAVNSNVTIALTGTNQSWTIFNAQYPNLKLAGSGTKTLGASSLTVLGDLTINSGVTFDATNATSTNTLKGDLTNNGTFSASTSSGSWVFSGSAAQTITGNVTLYNMTLNNSSGVTLNSGNLTVGNGTSGSLTLTSGKITTGTNKVVMPTYCSNGNISGSGWVNGNLQYTFPNFSASCTYQIGDASRYAPLTLAIPYFSDVATIGGLTLTASTTGSEHPQIATSGLNASRDVNRYWTLGASGDTFGCVSLGSDTFNPGYYTVTLQFNSADVDAGASTSSFRIGRYFGGWDTPAVTSTTSTTTTLKITPSSTSNFAPFGSFAVGQVSGSPSGSAVANNCSTSPAYSPLADWRMDESSWTGTASEVKDSSGNGYHGTAAYANGSGPVPTTLGISKAYTSGAQSTCNYGQFDTSSAPARTYTYVALPSALALPSQFTVSAWIKSTSPTQSGQRIFVWDDNQDGWGFSLGDPGTASLRLFNRNIFNSGSVTGNGSDPGCGVFCIDTNPVISANTWYFVAAAVDTTGKTVTLYIFDATGALLVQTSGGFSGSWTNGSGRPAIGGESASSGEGTQSSFHFNGNIDEVGVYPAALSQGSLANVLTRVRTCPTTSVNHYELSLPSSSVACLASTATVTACADTSSPCTNRAVAANGQTATLSTSGATLGSSSVTFNSNGVATTTLSYPTAADGTAVTVTLSGESLAATSARTCCADGTSCSTANSCSTTFKTAGFIFASAADGASTTIPSQIAGVSSATYYLRAVKTNTSTKACETALSGANTVNFGYECNDPTTCYTNDLMSVNGGTSTTISRNNNGSHTSTTAVSMTFDANGNAPFTFNYGDVGKVTLWATKAASGALLSSLTGATNPFVVKPYGFTVTSIKRTSDNVNNPAAANASGTKFVRAGDGSSSLSQFTATVTAVTQTGAVAPSFGRESTAESVTLTPVRLTTDSDLVADGTMYVNGTSGGRVSGFTNGIATPTQLGWSEVGIMKLTPTLTSANYMGVAGSVIGTATGNIGRFYPAKFGLASGTVSVGCGGFTYMTQPFTLGATVNAQNTLGGTTTNYNGTYAKGLGVYAAENANNGTDLSSRLTVSPSGTWSQGVFTLNATGSTFSRPSTSSPDATWGPYASLLFGISITDSDADTSGPLMNGADMDPASSGTCATCGYKQLSATTTSMRLGRLRLSNANGSELLDLVIPAVAQYWSGTTLGWQTSTGDTCTNLSAANFSFSTFSNLLPACKTKMTVSGSPPTPVLTLSKPGNGNSGWADITVNLGNTASGTQCSAVGSGSVAATPANMPWLQYTWTSSTISDPKSRATFGIYRSGPVIHRREMY